MRHAQLTGSIDLGSVSFGPTPVAMLIAVLVLAAITMIVLAIASLIGRSIVDRRWPADEPLTPSEILWGESGGYVKKTFPGLDPTIARDLTQYLDVRKVGPGEVVIEHGQLPTHFVLLKSGAAEKASAEGVTPIKAGEPIGVDNIMRRQASEYSVRTTAPSEVVRLSAEDYLAAVALGMSDDDDDYVVHMLAGVFAEPAAARAAAAAAPTTFAPPGLQRQWPSSTHRVTAAQLPGYVLPAGDSPTRVLAAGAEVQVFEGLPGWAHGRTADGWQGWLELGGLTAFE